MLVSQKLAIAAHLHVLLRRKTGRVTDTEWMAQNLEYALEIVRFTRAKAVEDGHADLDEWADKLERAVLEPSAVHKPLAQSAMQLLKDRHVAPGGTHTSAKAAAPDPSNDFGHSSFSADSRFNDSGVDQGKSATHPDPKLPRYIGGIR